MSLPQSSASIRAYLGPLKPSTSSVTYNGTTNSYTLKLSKLGTTASIKYLLYVSRYQGFFTFSNRIILDISFRVV